MHSSNINPIIQWWQGKSLPSYYFVIEEDRKPRELDKLIRLYYRTWVVHPIKRRLAKYYLQLLQNIFGLKVIAITGSSGKTTTKDMLYSILSTQGETVATQANIDPVFNIPTTILRCTPQTKFLILEVGVEYIGDMNFYMWLVSPNVGVITNIYQTHTLFFGNKEGVANEKGILVKSLKPNATAILNNENEYSAKMKTQAKIIKFGKGSNVRALNIELSLSGTEFNLEIDKQSLSANKEKVNINLSLIGEHFVSNSLASSATAHSLGISIDKIKSGLERFKAPEHRLSVKTLRNGAVILDDTYNNNPSAAKATLETVGKIVGKRKLIIVFGDMKELGKDEIEMHKVIGKLIDTLGASYVFGVGPLSRYVVGALKRTKGESLGNSNMVLRKLKFHLTSNSITLLKASRSIGLDQVVDKLN